MEDMNFDFSWDNLSKNLQANVTGGAKTYEKDTRFWKLSKDENGNGAALIRLLPDSNGKTMVKVFHYGIKKANPTGKKPLWYVANSPESVGLPCPVKEHYLKLMAEGTKEATDEAGKFKRQTKFVTNIMVVKDPSNPENEGKVFLFEFGTKMKDKFFGWLNPSDEEKAMGEEPKQLFNPIAGNSIKLKIKKQGEFFTWDPTEVVPTVNGIYADKETAVAAIKTSTYPLSEFESPDYYEPYTDLKTRFDKFLNGGKEVQDTAGTTSTTKSKVDTSSEFDELEEVSRLSVTKPTPVETSDDDESWLNDL
jgi:hypothetical protein